MINVGDRVKLIDKFYQTSEYKKLAENKEPYRRKYRKHIASLAGKEMVVLGKGKSAYGQKCVEVEDGTMIPERMVEKVKETKQTTYKVGDKVRIKCVEQLKQAQHINRDGKMDKWGWKVMTIKAVQPHRCWCEGHGTTGYNMVEDAGEFMGDGWTWFDDMIHGKYEGKNVYSVEQVAQAKIIVYDTVMPEATTSFGFTSDGKTLRLLDHRSGKVTEAKCSENDEYNVHIGRMVACCKMTGREMPEWIK